MADYTQITDFSAKDVLASGDPEKVILGADVDAELGAINTAIASKANSATTPGTGGNVFSGAQVISSTAPALALNETGQAADEGKWAMYADEGVLAIAARTDADADGDYALVAVRSTGAALDYVAVGGHIIDAGEYTPTLTEITNIGTGTPGVFQYMRIGSRVHVVGVISVSATAGSGATTEFEIDLPVASNFGASADAVGVIMFGNDAIAGPDALLAADTTSNEVEIRYTATTTSAVNLYISFMYKVI